MCCTNNVRNVVPRDSLFLYPHDLVLAVGWVGFARRGWLGLEALPRFLFFSFFYLSRLLRSRHPSGG
jgi:hypothetical protein